MTRALLSVYNKTGIVEFARELHALGWELISSGGTATTISAAGIPVTDVAEITGYPAILGDPRSSCSHAASRNSSRSHTKPRTITADN